MDRARRLQPDLVLLDLQVSVMDGFQAARQIRDLCPSCRVVVLTVHGDGVTQQGALQAVVHSFLVRGVSIETLFQAIMHRGE